MPRDLPGFYFDAEKNKYFSIKGPIPGSSHNSSAASTSAAAQKPTSKHHLVNKSCRTIGKKTTKLLQVRELYGNVITCSKGKCNFQEEFQKIQASQPTVWKYHGTERIGDVALEQLRVDIDSPHGIIGKDILLAGSANGYLSFCEFGNVGQQLDYGIRCMPECIRPLNTDKQERFVVVHLHLWRRSIAPIHMGSNISSLKVYGGHSSTDASPTRDAMITTLGSEKYGGSVYILGLREPLNLEWSSPTTVGRLSEVTSFPCTVWTADCNSGGTQAVVGTNLGAALVNMEIGVKSWILRCKSDVLSLQLDHSGNIVLCGLRNGAIVTVDARQKSEGLSTRHQIPYLSHRTCKPSSGTSQNFGKRRFELKSNLSSFTFMPSSVSCLASLQMYDTYFLASSMDGSIWLYDQRLMQRGPIQFYEGNVNSHTRIQLGVDPYERIIMSGGEDCNLRLWDIKSGEMLFEDKFMNSIPSVVCWPKEVSRVQDYGQDHSWGAWLGSQEGIFRMRWP